MTVRYLLQVIVAVILLNGILAPSFSAATIHDQAKPQAKASDAEVKAVAAINSAPDATAKLTQAEAFIKKYPKSALRLEVAQALTNEIGNMADAGQRLTLAERFLKAFSGDAESEGVRTMVVSEYVIAKRVDDAFTMGATILAKKPDSLGVLTTLAIVGTDEVKKQNTKYSTQTWLYGLKAIELLEANQKPANMDEAYWSHQRSLLPQLYLNMGALALAGGKPAEARPRLERAIELSPTDPSGYFFLGSLIDDEYRTVAEAHQAMPEGKEKQDTLKKATDLMDKVIDLYARALGAASDKPEYKAMYDQVMESIRPYYRYRYKSTTGLQPLIDKYKTPAKP